jgi:glutamate racemase
VMGRDVVLVSSGEETAFEVAAVLDTVGARRLSRPGEEPARHRCFTSGDPATFRTLGSRFIGPVVNSVEAWRWS